MVPDPTVRPGARSNNLDSLRLILAALVVLEHSNNLFHVALDSAERFSFFLLNMSDVAVSSFFVISGMLTWMSIERDRDITRFYLRRFFRVFPAYWAIVMVQILVFALIAAPLVQWDKLPTYALFNALTANFLQPSFIEGIPALNGSLWTIKIEASYYLLLPALFAFMLRPKWLVLIAALSFVWATTLDHPTLAKQLPGKLYLFAAGVALARIYPLITDRHSLIAMLLLPLTILAKFTTEDMPYLSEICEAALGLCLVIAFKRAWVQREPMDISYTLYLVHYPVLVLVTRFLFPAEPFWVILPVGVILSFAFAIVLSLLVERPALRLGRRLVSRSGKPRIAPSGTGLNKT